MEIRELTRHELEGVWSIDRSEVVEGVYRHEGGALVLEPRHIETRGWPPGEPEEYGPLLLDCFDRGGACHGALAGPTLVGAAVLESRFIGRKKDQLQLKFLHVSQRHRHAGLGRALFAKTLASAKKLGARRLYVSATSSENTVRFYLDLGWRATDEVDDDLFALEPEDIHLEFDIPR